MASMTSRRRSEPQDPPVNILLVDDTPAKLLSYEAMLAELGENLIRANSANEALEHLLNLDVAVIVLDVNMPGMDGFELATMIRQHPRYQKTAIIHVSAVSLSELDHVRGYQSGAVDYLAVPIVPDLLRAKVRVFVDLYRKTRELERLNRELEDRVGERTHQLETSMQQLTEQDRRKDQFLAMLAHELRNPLAAISSAQSVIRSAGRSETQAEKGHGVIERQTNHLRRLIDDLLDVSRVASDKLDLQKESLELADVVTTAVDSLRPEIEARGIQLSLAIPQESVPLSADRVRLAQVFTNLLDNAAKFTPKGGSILLEVERQGAQAAVRVQDDGIGMDPKSLAQVFEMFFQVDQSLERSQGGLGLGLTLARRLVEMHGGRLEASSPGLGKGSQFVAWLPLLTIVHKAEPAAQPPSRAKDAPQTPPAPLRVLIADDNVDTAESFNILLKLNGYETQLAHDGRQALEQVRTQRPDIAIVDIGMPQLNGYDVARRIREEPWGKHIFLIAATGWAQPEDRRRTHEAGFDIHLVKPVEPDVLLNLLQQWAKARNGDAGG
jgi:signal transduction histidine kinase